MNLTFTDDNGQQTPIEAKPVSVHAKTSNDGTQIHLTVTWDRDDLAVDDPDGYKAVQCAWPGHGTLTVTIEDDPQQPPQNPGTPGEPEPLPTEADLFKGTVAAVSLCENSVAVEAVADTPNDGGDEPGDDAPVITGTPNSGDAIGLTIDFTVDNKAQGAGSLDFGDGTAAASNAGDGTTATSHAYAAAGAYTVTFTDDDQAGRTASYAVTLPPTA